MKFNYLSAEQLLEGHIMRPGPDTIDVCIAQWDALSFSPRELSVLPDAEQERGRALRQETDRLAFFAGKILLRSALSSYLNCAPEILSFKTGSHGKPYLFSPSGTISGFRPDIHFNLSHSGSYIAIAFSSAAPIGIDIEKVRKNLRAESLVRRFFHPDEYAQFQNMPEDARQEFIFRRWTVREAFLKGLGDGLSISPGSFLVSGLDNGFCIKKSQKDYSSWHISPIPAPDGYYCSIAYQLDFQMPPV